MRGLGFRAAGAVAAGLLLVPAFPPYGQSWLAPLAVALATLVWHGTRARHGAWLGALTGVVFLLGLCRWMTVIGDDAWLALCIAFGVWVAVAGAVVAGTSRLRWWPWIAAAAWVLEEALAARQPFGGFPWGRLAWSQADSWLTPYAALGGAPLVSFATAVVGVLLAYAWTVRTRRRLAVASLGLVVALPVAARVVPLPVAGQDTGGPPTTTAAVVQGNVPAVGMDFLGQPRQVLDNHVRETEALAARVKAGQVPAPLLVVWPENSSDIDPFADASAAAEIQGAVDAIGVPVLVGAVVTAPDDPTHVWNTGIVWGPTGSAHPGPGDHYVKRHPVPFGEWVPFRPLLSALIDRFDRVPRDFAPGPRPGVLDVGPARLGVVICFEVAYDDIMREAATGTDATGGLGGRVLAVQTNNADYAFTGQPEQQVAMARLRAVEHGRAVLVAATSGITAVIAPDGTVQQSLPEFTAGSLVAQVPLRDSLTVADRVGAWPELVLCLFALGGVAAAVRRSRRSAQHVGSTEQPVAEETRT